MEKMLIFPETEYRDRLDQLRKQMEQAAVEVLLLFDPENIFYLTGHQTFGIQEYQCCVVTLEEDPILVLRFLESFNGQAFSWIDSIEIYDDHEDPVAVTTGVLSANGWQKRRVGADDASLFFPPTVRQRLYESLGDHLVSAPGLVENCRAIKSPAEIAYIRKAALYTDLGILAAEEAARSGVSENDIAAAAHFALTSAGSEYVQVQPIVTSGWRAGIPHTTYQRKLVEPGDSILVELTGTHHRYVSPLMRTFMAGHTKDGELSSMYAICEEALAAVLEKIGSGETAGSVDDVARNVIDRAGYGANWRKRTGYSVGFSFPPGWGEGNIVSLRHKSDVPLAPGMVFHIPIALRDYKSVGVGVSETVLVTDEGCEVLGNAPRGLVNV